MFTQEIMQEGFGIVLRTEKSCLLSACVGGVKRYLRTALAVWRHFCFLVLPHHVRFSCRETRGNRSIDTAGRLVVPVEDTPFCVPSLRVALTADLSMPSAFLFLFFLL